MLNRKLSVAIVVYVLLAFTFASFPESKALDYVYVLHGPYYEDGTVAPATVNITVLWINGAIGHLYLDASGGVADSVTIDSVNAITTMSWNSSSAMNMTRIYDFAPTTPSDINIYVSDPNLPVTLYSFSVTDFAGMINPFIQSSISPDGITQYSVESRSLNGSSAVTFVMTQYALYTLTISCQQGTYAQQFLAETTFSTNLPVLAGTFPTTNLTYPSFSAQRTNATMITVSYVDPSSLTDWIYVNITHQSGSITINDYSYNTTDSSLTLLWNDGSASVSYSVSMTASINGQLTTWTQPVAVPPNSNPWLGIFDFLGQNTPTLPHVFSGWPNGVNSYQIAQIVGAVIITVFLGIGSFRNAGASCIMACIAAGIMFAMGWWNGGVSQASISALPELGLAFFVAILTHFNEKKSEGAGLS